MITRKLVVTMTALVLFISLFASDIFAGGWGGGMHKGGRGGGRHQYRIRRGRKGPGGGQDTKIHAVDCPQGVKVYSNNNGTLTPATGASIITALQSSGSFEVEGTCTDSGGAATAAPSATPVPAGSSAAPTSSSDGSDGSDGSSDGSSTAATSTASSYDYDNE